jgi:thioredoxin
MAKEDIVHLTDENFKNDTQKGVVLVDFHAEWCGPCRMIAPVLEAVAGEVKGKARIAKVDIDHAQQIASTFQVTSVPTLILFKDGNEVGRLVGLRDAAAIKDFILSAHGK